MEEPIHEHFGLSYANYLVLPRTALQSMPEEWQRKFVDLLDELHENIDTMPDPICEYMVKAKNCNGKFVHDPLADYQRGRRKLLLTPPNKPE